MLQPFRQETSGVVHAIKHFVQDPNRIKLAYCDNAEELTGALNQLRIPGDTSFAGDPQTNSIIERRVQIAKRGTRVLLESAGLPLSYWPLAMQAFCFMRNCILEDGDGKTPWAKRHGYKLKTDSLNLGR